MNIVYVAKHDSGGNDDEGAIHYALESLGHKVQRVREVMGHKAPNVEGDVCLFHKWEDVASIRRMPCPKVFWYFDLVEYEDPTLAKRNANRVAWMRRIVPAVDLGFCTDGDWVNKDQSGKLLRLLQGADVRYAGRGEGQDIDCDPPINTPPILLTGIRNGGRLRSSFVDEMAITYGTSFQNVTHGIHQQSLADLIARSRFIVAPDGPVTDHYWSNRVYNTLGFGGFLLHPYCATLTQHYHHGREIVYYANRRELHELIKQYWNAPEERLRIAMGGLDRTLREHTYTHRCRQLMNIIRERLFNGTDP